MSITPESLDSMLSLKYPQSVAVFDTYPQAQKAVDYLADQDFPVNNLAIVGTDLKTVERVTGRRTWSTVLGQGAVSGLFMGGFVGLMLMLFTQPGGRIVILLSALAFGIVFGMISQSISYAATRGARDFNSVRQMVASRYEVLAEHQVAAKAREVLATMPGAAPQL